MAAKWNRFKDFLLKPQTVLYIYVLATILITVQRVVMPKNHAIEGHFYTHYNNYVIFKQAFFHLIAGKDLYIAYPDECWDLFKYSPAFALFMGTMAYLPDFAGLLLWNLINSMVLYKAVRMLPLTERKQSLFLWFVLVEMITALQSSQSNALMAGLIIAAFALMERNKASWATLLLVIATFIKIYGAVGFIIFLFYPGKLRFILWSVVWTVFFAIVPLAVVSPGTLLMEYKSWANMMAADQAASFGFSVMGWLHSWFGLDGLKNYITLAGIILFFVPLLRYKLYNNLIFRMLFLAQMLVWVIIFNHKAESPTFIIAVSGVVVWYYSLETINTWQKTLVYIVFIFTCLSPTEVFPPAVRRDILVPYVIKAVPCILAWVILFSQLMVYKPLSANSRQ